MFGTLYLAIFIFCGLFIVRCLLPRHTVLTRTWLGTSLGLLLLMWLPALMAFAVDFTVKAHLLALLPLAALTGGAFLLRDRRLAKGWDAAETTLARQMLTVVLPLTLLSGYLQFTHYVRMAADGSWWGGQSTYGDLAMHMSFVTSLKNASFPPEYSLFPGQQLSYPFLMDSLSTSLYLMGFSLQASMVIPGTLMMALCYMGVMCLAREMTVGKKTVILAALLFFLNGGLGFIYDFDLAGGTETVWMNGEWTETPTLWARIQNILNGYYMTPTNQPTPNNLRWSNVIADLMLPQRTLLGGWCMVIPCFYLLFTAFHREDMAKTPLRQVVLLGVWGGALPLIHTHSFTALALCSVGLLVYDMFHCRDRLQRLGWYALYGGIACVLSVPQLFGFTFGQVFQEGMQEASNSFIEPWFNWVNSSDGTLSGMIDGYGWFYLKNIGLPFLMLIFALCERNPRWRRLFAGALPIILAAEFVRFQPNIYDNNKLLYLAWLLCAMIVADWCGVVWRKLKDFRARPFIAALAAVTIFLSAGLTLWRECVSNYQLFSAGAVQAGEFVRDNTEEDAVFLTGVHHLNPVASIGGRRIVCGPDLWLYYHGLDTNARKEDIARFYGDPAGNLDVLETYGVDYIAVSSYERHDYQPDIAALDALYTRVYQNGEMIIWQVAAAAQGEE
ncbi:MAG: hypothetical protein IKK57_02620 [Clostridia bacterium]|nr:hypothetical protein [Clostridia bacterium]